MNYLDSLRYTTETLELLEAEEQGKLDMIAGRKKRLANQKRIKQERANRIHEKVSCIISEVVLFGAAVLIALAVICMVLGVCELGRMITSL